MLWGEDLRSNIRLLSNKILPLHTNEERVLHDLPPAASSPPQDRTHFSNCLRCRVSHFYFIIGGTFVSFVGGTFEVAEWIHHFIMLMGGLRNA